MFIRITEVVKTRRCDDCLMLKTVTDDFTDCLSMCPLNCKISQ